MKIAGESDLGRRKIKCKCPEAGGYEDSKETNLAEEGEEQEMKVMEAREFTVHVGLIDHHKDFDLHSDTISGRFWAT